jgi:S1-C subfamily serine protease
MALVCAPVAQSFADEGFFTDNKPPAVRAIWPSVYALVCEGRGSVYIASAFLVAKVRSARRKARTDYVFVTAGHAIAACKRTRQHLAENINQPYFEPDGITVARPRRLKGVKVVHVDDAYDLALIKVEASATLRIGTPVPVDDKCDPDLHERLYAVGFPGVGKRRSLHVRREEKRWTRGEIVGLGKADFDGTEELYIASTVDSLPGSSGGPVVNESGVLIGVVAKGVATEDNKFRYDVDAKDPRDWQTFLAPCTAVLRLLQKAGVPAQ